MAAADTEPLAPSPELDISAYADSFDRADLIVDVTRSFPAVRRWIEARERDATAAVASASLPMLTAARTAAQGQARTAD